MSFSPILWQGKQPAYLVFIFEHIPSAIEQKERKRFEVFTTAMRAIYDYAFDVNITTGLYEFFAEPQCLPVSMAKQGDYMQGLSTVCPTIHKDFQEAFKQVFALDNLGKGAFVEMEYLAYEHGTYRWKHRQSFPYTQGDGSSHVLSVVRDVHSAKEEALRNEWKEKSIQLALRNSYCEIYEVDLLQNKAFSLYRSSNLATIDNRTLERSVALLVHPEDKAHVLRVYGGHAIQHAFRKGCTEFVDEYRRLGIDGRYHWVQSIMVAMNPKEELMQKGLLLVRDISEQKELQQKQRIADQYACALRNLYDELYVINVTQQSYTVMHHTARKYAAPAAQGSLEELLRYTSTSLVHPQDEDLFLQFISLPNIKAFFSLGHEHRIGEFRMRWADGSYHWSSLTMFPVENTEGMDETYLVFVMDISAKKEAEAIAQKNTVLEQQRLDDERYRTIIEQTDTLVFEWWAGKQAQYRSPELEQRFAGTYDGRNVLAVWREDGVIHPNDAAALAMLAQSVSEGKAHAEMTVRLYKRTGTCIWCRVAVTCLHDKKGNAVRFIGTVNDVHTATESMQELRFRAEYDVLTKLYNMSAFYLHAAEMLQQYPEQEYYLVRIDIERFKLINDLYGLAAGDTVLQGLAAVLAQEKGLHDVCGRIGADIFCLLVAGSKEKTIELTENITKHLAQKPLTFPVKVVFGICPVENKENPINMLCDWANLALKTIKGSCLHTYAFYDEGLRKQILQEKHIEGCMDAALRNGEFIVYLQPKVHIPTSRIVGAEGLVRWQHPEKGLIAPNHFIPFFEKNGFILQLDEYVWEEACKMLCRWIQQGHSPLPISINMSRRHIHDPLLHSKLTALVQKYALVPSLLQLEVTESAFLENENDLYTVVNSLREDCFLLSMDDFGSGYSSLNMLKNIPVDFIKIDKGFINEVATTERGKTVIRHSIAMAHEMNIGLIAEGVETEEQAAFLLHSGCAYAQGYFYSRPLPLNAFEALAFGQVQPPFPVAETIKKIVALT
ncbi:MAG: EAL domain-containing protein [Desulfovibrionaceae bacterium]|nr:EAL domain-containing protein [Desulfovibrionaceae bacterium]